ncbi:MogA/MoaB family molybdenum cofactor biosynthesis protein [Halarchaeum salinum]|uniref:Molybdenum cofactor biosynthesis protein MoaB n=1 Tax=Halarchaeum salinum TaxID=489912 RepID=A0AAV3SAI0_9EURY
MVDFQSRDTRRMDDDERAEAKDESADDEGEEHDHGDHEGHSDHGHHAHDAESVMFGVVTVSSSREADDDPSGDAIVALIEDASHEVAARDLVDDDFDDVQGTVDRLVRDDGVDAVVTTGGTGVTPDDVTVEAVDALYDKSLPGFGELFRRLSYDEIGTRVVGTRATAGVANGVPVFCLPGSESAVRLGVSDVILPEIGHLVGLARRDEDGAEADDEPGVSPEKGDGDEGSEAQEGTE